MLQSSRFWIGSIPALLSGRRDFVHQTGRSDCGVASALTVMNMLSREAEPVQAVDDLDPNRTGTSLDSLCRYFQQQQGIEAKPLSVPANLIGDIRGPAILHMTQQHYVVLLRAGKTGVLVFDPSVGPVFYPPADFASLYSGALVAIAPAPGAGTVPAVHHGAGTPAGGPGRAVEPVALFIVGFATRLLEFAVLLCLVAALFLVLNRASFSSLFLAFGLIVVCGGLLLVAHQIRYEGEESWIGRTQSRIWRALMRVTFRSRDLNGFRGRVEKDVSASLRKGLSVAIPQRSQVPAALGAFCAVPALLSFLSPVVAVIHVALFGGLLVATRLDGVKICRRSVRKGTGRYSKLGQGHDLLSTASAPDLMGEIAKWTVIGFAGFSVLAGALPPVALMFWILAAMQIVPIDFRKVTVLSGGLSQPDPVSVLTASEVPVRRQRIAGPVDLTIRHENGLIRIDGISPLTQCLNQPDLTVREQRLIMADVVRHTFDSLPKTEFVPGIGPIRIFGPGQNATQSDFEHLMIAKESRPKHGLPVPVDTRKALDLGAQDPVLRDLHSCDPGDFPVFWDFRERLAVTDLQARLAGLGVARAGHLTMKRLTVVEAA